jgi:hypothetical protein
MQLSASGAGQYPPRERGALDGTALSRKRGTLGGTAPRSREGVLTCIILFLPRPGPLAPYRGWGALSVVCGCMR